MIRCSFFLKIGAVYKSAFWLLAQGRAGKYRLNRGRESRVKYQGFKDGFQCF